MTKEQVIFTRELYKDNTRGFIILLDNVKTISTKNDGTFIIWDDENEIIHVLRPNVSQYTQLPHPIEVESIPYDIFQGIISIETIEGLTPFLELFKSRDLIDEDKIDTIIKYYEKLK